MEIIKEKYKRLVALVMFSGLLYVATNQLAYIHKGGGIDSDKFFLQLFPLLFVIVFLYQKTKFGFGLTTFYVVMRLLGSITTLYLYASAVPVQEMFLVYPVNIESISALVITLISVYTLMLLHREYWHKIM